MNNETPRPSPPVAENGHVPEIFGEGDVGLQARLLTGDLTSPRLTLNKKKLQSIAEQGAQGITQQTAGIYEKASITQRRRHQEATGITFSQWQNGFNDYLQSIRQDTEHRERKAFLETIGIADTIHAGDFYSRYLREGSDIVKFVDDIERVATREQIEQHQDIIRNLGNAFGYESSGIINHLIHGVRNVKTHINVFILEARKTINTSEVLNNPLLQKTREDSGLPKKLKEAPPVIRKPTAKVSPAKATAVRRVDMDRETERSFPKPAAKPRKAEQIFPAPIHEEEDEEEKVHLITQEELDATIRLLYGDVYRQDIGKEVAILKATEKINYYGRELYAMMQEYGRDVVLEKATNAVHLLHQYVNKVGLRVDKRSKSQSWYLWGIAKSRFLANNPGVQNALPNADKYDPFDPLLHYHEGTQSHDGQKSQKAENDIIEGMLGWEVYRQRKKLGTILLHLNPMMDQQDKERLRVLLSEDPKKDQQPPTLASYQLREIGRIVKTNMQVK